VQSLHYNTIYDTPHSGLVAFVLPSCDFVLANFQHTIYVLTKLDNRRWEKYDKQKIWLHPVVLLLDLFILHLYAHVACKSYIEFINLFRMTMNKLSGKKINFVQ
jgi:hypothetical protein